VRAPHAGSPFRSRRPRLEHSTSRTGSPPLRSRSPLRSPPATGGVKLQACFRGVLKDAGQVQTAAQVAAIERIIASALLQERNTLWQYKAAVKADAVVLLVAPGADDCTRELRLHTPMVPKEWPACSPWNAPATFAGYRCRIRFNSMGGKTRPAPRRSSRGKRRAESSGDCRRPRRSRPPPA